MFKSFLGKILIFMSIFTSLLVFASGQKPIKSFAIYYGFEAPASSFKDFDLVVLESSNTSIVKELKKSGKTVLAYLSIGEVNKSRDYFEYLKEKGLLLEENPNWPDAFLIDIRNPEWENCIVSRILPDILDSGFDGIFIDTLDSSLDKEDKNPLKYRGMKKAAVGIIKAMKKKFPDMKIMLNRAYEIAPDCGNSIEYILGESTCSVYDFKEKKYLPCDEEAFKYESELLKNIQKKNPSLLVMTLDYTEEDDMKRRKEIYKRQRAQGFIPYVTTIGLDKVSPLPSK